MITLFIEKKNHLILRDYDKCFYFCRCNICPEGGDKLQPTDILQIYLKAHTASVYTDALCMW